MGRGKLCSPRGGTEGAETVCIAAEQYYLNTVFRLYEAVHKQSSHFEQIFVPGSKTNNNLSDG